MKKLTLALALVATLLLTGCEGFNVNVEGGLTDLISYYDIETATVVYDYTTPASDDGTLTLYFTENGKKERIEISAFEGFEGSVAFIFNKEDSTITTLAQYLEPQTDSLYKIYYQRPNEVIESAHLLYLGSTVDLTVDTLVYPTFDITTDTIAGKPCEIMTFIDQDSMNYCYGGWKKIIMICEIESLFDYPVRAISVSEQLPDSLNLFAVPDDYSDATTLPFWNELENMIPQF